MKPLDFGGGGVNGSVDAYGRIIALNFYHPEHGYVTLTSADPFPEDQRYNPQAVRAYRKSLVTLEGFGFTGIYAPHNVYTHLKENLIPRTSLRLSTGLLTVNTCTVEGYAGQWWYPHAVEELRFRGRISLQRCAYSQLTEGGPVLMPDVITRLTLQDAILTVENPAIPFAVAMVGLQTEAQFEKQTKGSIEFDFEAYPNGWLVFVPGRTAAEAREKAAAVYERIQSFEWLEKKVNETVVRWSDPSQDSILIRGLVYSCNMAVPVGEGSCLLTDHMLLPLSWNRDAYYLARALLSWHGDVKDIVRRHLIWMFEIAERTPEGTWARCYMANGRIKDGAFQLDQQLFPLLELAEYTLETGGTATFERLKPHITPVIDMLLARKAAHAALFPTDETPADDPIALPYHLSSHILFWTVLNKLKRLGMEWGTLQDDLKTTVERDFVTELNGKRLYSYATDGAGRHHLYHDANDFPTVLAPVWGFCAVDDPVWRNTIDFAFSEANREGVYQGRLGSVHTRAPWSLGDVQELIVARLLNDTAREARALKYLQLAAQPDGALPEAYDAETGDVVSRHWFAWPNAAYACVMLNAFKE
jgi:uncharacterized protein